MRALKLILTVLLVLVMVAMGVQALMDVVALVSVIGRGTPYSLGVVLGQLTVPAVILIICALALRWIRRK